ncbi:PAS domain S-box protein [Kiritimatiellaeota bacterium B1221]|nr:PAS domain S-box protein [Kiritimatiellaeota bacterium B1221]
MGFLLAHDVPAGRRGPPEKDLLTQEERAWLQAHDGRIRFAPSPSYAPVSFRGEDGRYHGITLDYLQRLEHQLGFRFEMVHCHSWNEILEMARAGEVDVVGNIHNTPDREAYLRFTEPYFKIPSVLFTRNDHKFSALSKTGEGWQVAVVEGDASGNYLEKHYPEVEVVCVRDHKEGLMAVSTGQIDSMLTDLAVASHVIERHGITNLQVGQVLEDHVWELRFASRKDWPLLQGILEKGLESISDTDRKQIYSHWISIKQNKPFYQDWRVYGVVIVTLLFGGLMAWIWTGSLRYMVLRKTEALRLSEERFRLATQAGGLGVWDWDIQSGHLIWNDRMLEIYGMKREDFDGDLQTWKNFVHPEDLIQSINKPLVSEKKEETFDNEYRIIRGDGQIRHIRAFGKVIFNERHSPVRVTGTNQDITAAKNAEYELEANEKRFRGIIEHSTNVFYSHTPEGQLTYISQQVKNIMGYEVEEALVNWRDLTSDLPENQIGAERTERAIRTGKPQPTYEMELLHKQGHTFWAEVREAPVVEEGKVVAVVGSLTDITERKEAAKQIERSRTLLEQVINANPDLLWMKNRDGVFIVCNAPFAELVGTPIENVFGSRDSDFFPETQAEICAEQDRLAIQNLKSGTFIEPLRHVSAGKDVWYEITKTPVVDAEGELVGVLGVGHDITERKEIEERISDWARFPEENPNPVLRILQDLTLTHANPAALTLLTEPGLRIGEKIPEEWRPMIQKAFEAGKVTKMDMEMNQSIFDLTLTPILERGYLNLYARDKSDEVKLEATLRQSQKLESIGRLAGGVAHDFNNLLTGIMGYVELCKSKVEPDDPVAEWLDDIGKISERSADLTRQLLAFARKQIVKPKRMDLNETVQAMLKILQRLIGEDIALEWKPSREGLAVYMDRSQLDQILTNLCVNARDAIEGVGTITLSAAKRVVDPQACALISDAAPGEYVRLRVEDTGKGLSPQMIESIFEPFYTTKEVGEGTGLGLATVHGIVKQNRGFIQVESALGKGSAFNVHLPLSRRKAESESRVASEGVPGGTETILLVEDEKAILTVTSLFLKQQGYQVLAAESPLQALELVEKYAEKLDLIITDVVMPGMSGPDLLRRLVLHYPNIKCIYISGYTADFMSHDDLEHTNRAFLSKPFSSKLLIRVVREMLDGTYDAKK